MRDMGRWEAEEPSFLFPVQVTIFWSTKSKSVSSIRVRAATDVSQYPESQCYAVTSSVAASGCSIAWPTAETVKRLRKFRPQEQKHSVTILMPRKVPCGPSLFPWSLRERSSLKGLQNQPKSQRTTWRNPTWFLLLGEFWAPRLHLW